MSSKRSFRLNGEMRRIISSIIRNDVKDPRISMMLSITDVSVTNDLKECKVYISDLNDIDGQIDALNKAKGFIKKEIGNRMKIRRVPELIFVKDESIERGIYMNKLINQVMDESEKNNSEKESLEKEEK